MISIRSTTALLWTVFLFVRGSAAVAAPLQPPPAAPTATLSVAIDSGAPLLFAVTGIVESSGAAKYVVALAPNGTGLQIDVALLVDWKSNPQSGITGTIVVKNNGAAARVVNCAFELPICPPITEGSKLAATVTVKLTTTGPAGMACSQNTPIIQILCNSQTAQTLFICPFSLSISGRGEIGATKSFDAPGGMLPGPASVSTIGVRNVFSITPMAKVTTTHNLTFIDVNGAQPPSCLADLNDSGTVNAVDLVVVLSQWGVTSACPETLVGDISGNGIVDAVDLTMILGAWGPCPP